MDNITWFQVPGFDHIEITKCGRIRVKAYFVERIDRWGKLQKYHFKMHEVSPYLHSNGYFRCSIQKNTKRGPLYVHRLIATTFVDGYVDGYHVNHINGLKTDNRPENLEWVPNEENVKHQWRTGLANVGPHTNPASKLNPKKVYAIRRAIAAGLCNTTIATLSDVNPSTISSIREGKTWKNVCEDVHG